MRNGIMTNKKIPLKKQIRDFIEKNPQCDIEKISSGIKEDEKKIKKALYSAVYYQQVIKDEHDKYTINKDWVKYQRKNKESISSRSIVVNEPDIVRTPTVAHDPITEIPSHVTTAINSLEKLTIDRQICIKALQDIKQTVDATLNNLLKN